MSKAVALILCLVLAACSSGTGLLEKSEPAPVVKDSLIRPPWQTLVRAGPGAAQDIDYETLDGPQAPAGPPPALPDPSQQAAADPATPPADAAKPADASKPATDASKPQAAQKDAKPGTEISAVAVVAVTGSPEQGAKELTAAMRQVLRDAGWPVVETPSKNALAIKGDVKLDAAGATQQGVHITWVVTSPTGKNIGQVAQNNNVPPHSLDSTWGQTADMAAQAAADGISKLIDKYR